MLYANLISSMKCTIYQIKSKPDFLKAISFHTAACKNSQAVAGVQNQIGEALSARVSWVVVVSNLWNSSFKLPVFICCYTRQSLSIPSFKSLLLLLFESSPAFQNLSEHLTADLYWIKQPHQHRLLNSTIPCSSRSRNPLHFYQLETILVSKAQSLLQQLQALLKSSKYFTLLVFWLQLI